MMNTQQARRVLETALICSAQPLPMRDLRVLFNEELGADTLRGRFLGIDATREGKDLAVLLEAEHQLPHGRAQQRPQPPRRPCRRVSPRNRRRAPQELTDPYES